MVRFHKIMFCTFLISLIILIISYLIGYKFDTIFKKKISDAEYINEKLDISILMKKANAEAGKGLIKRCISCHNFEKGAPHKIGPNLWGVFNLAKGNNKYSSYSFSKALNNKRGVWNEESLFYFLNKPSKYIPGTKMSFIGIEDTQDIVDIISFLKNLND